MDILSHTLYTASYELLPNHLCVGHNNKRVRREIPRHTYNGNMTSVMLELYSDC